MHTPHSTTPLTYQAAGVDITAGNELVEQIKPIIKQTRRPEVVGGLGGFGALFQLPLERYHQPLLASATDGVGTKLRLAIQLGIYHTVGIDLVAMCVNDLVVLGAEPLFFLDYYATGKLDVQAATQVIQGIAQGCQQAGAALVGGETAEMPGMYQAGDYDLAGFCVGIVEREQVIDGSQVASGDILIGLSSSGLHANGYSLVRKIIDAQQHDLQQSLGKATLAETLLTPTRIYVQSLLPLARAGQLKACAHITGGGFIENIPRVLPEHLAASINPNSWQTPAIFDWLQQQGQIATAEMYRTFNCGIGMIICVSPDQADHCLQHLNNHDEQAQIIGHIITRQDNAVVFQS